ncbi:MAG: transcription repressor NadR [Firmicutes bacterium]|jgi:transcriptional regulator of NAD metabolism|nr:transcription repressor NadR [Bacillota bacterium]
MNKEERREEILKRLGEGDRPITGSELSSALGVTRQVIVSDVAVLRARGEKIIATPQGYLLYPRNEKTPYRWTIAVRHGGNLEEIQEELITIVDYGGVVVDVTVEHALYGELTANLQVGSAEDVRQFVMKMAEAQAEPLLVLTEGYHLHSIEADSEETMGRILDVLREKGFLVE